MLGLIPAWGWAALAWFGKDYLIQRPPAQAGAPGGAAQPPSPTAGASPSAGAGPAVRLSNVVPVPVDAHTSPMMEAAIAKALEDDDERRIRGFAQTIERTHPVNAATLRAHAWHLQVLRAQLARMGLPMGPPEAAPPPPMHGAAPTPAAAPTGPAPDPRDVANMIAMRNEMAAAGAPAPIVAQLDAKLRAVGIEPGAPAPPLPRPVAKPAPAPEANGVPVAAVQAKDEPAPAATPAS